MGLVLVKILLPKLKKIPCLADFSTRKESFNVIDPDQEISILLGGLALASSLLGILIFSTPFS